MKPVFADTFYYLALVNRKDSFHDKAVDIARTLRVPVLTPAWIMTELADALADISRRDVFVKLLEGLKQDPDITIVMPEPSLYEDGLYLICKSYGQGLVIDGLHFFCDNETVADNRFFDSGPSLPAGRIPCLTSRKYR